MHMDRPVFVFGSDLSGRHDKGVALEALRNRGAVYGKGLGFHSAVHGSRRWALRRRPGTIPYRTDGGSACMGRRGQGARYVVGGTP